MTTRNETRSETLREQNLREENWTFEEPNALTIPDPVPTRFDNQGLALRWIRISIKGNDDQKNVGNKLQLGGSLYLQMKFQKWLSHPSCGMKAGIREQSVVEM